MNWIIENWQAIAIVVLYSAVIRNHFKYKEELREIWLSMNLSTKAIKERNEVALRTGVSVPSKDNARILDRTYERAFPSEPR